MPCLHLYKGSFYASAGSSKAPWVSPFFFYYIYIIWFCTVNMHRCTGKESHSQHEPIAVSACTYTALVYYAKM